MPELTAASAILRITNEDGKRIFSVNKVSPTVSATTAAGFVDAVEKLYNNGECDARLSVVMDLAR